MRSVINITDLDVDEISQLLASAHAMIESPHEYRNLAVGKTLATLFYEPSTRTRLSFESAMYSLGGNVLSMPSASHSSAVKGETINDTLAVVSNYADIVAIRHPNDGAALVACEAAGVPVINAGDGGHFHPTQTLADLLTIDRNIGRLHDLTVVFVGDLLYGRTVHSLLHALIRYPNNKFILISPAELRLPAEFVARLRENGAHIVECDSFAGALAEADVIYMTRVQQERFTDQTQYARLKDTFVLDPAVMATAPETSIILHPLPRVGEIDPELDHDPRAKYFEQTFNGKMMRAALIHYLLSDAQSSRTKINRAEIAKSVHADGRECSNPRCVTHIERGLMTRVRSEDGRCAYCDSKL